MLLPYQHMIQQKGRTANARPFSCLGKLSYHLCMISNRHFRVSQALP